MTARVGIVMTAARVGRVRNVAGHHHRAAMATAVDPAETARPATALADRAPAETARPRDGAMIAAMMTARHAKHRALLRPR
jgi:hypothetical protein